MLTTETYVLEEAIDELDDHIERLEDALEDVDPDSGQFERLTARKDRLAYFRNGLQWQLTEEDWSPDAEIELGAMTAAEEAMMHRESTSGADRNEMRLWFVAASTVDAPYAADEMSETFQALGQCHPAFVEWCEAKANALGVPGTGNESAGEPTSTS